MRILFLCTGGNSCRSLIAEAVLQQIDPELEVFSAGIHPDAETNTMAILVMDEIGIDIRDKKPKHYAEFENFNFDYLITLCDGTKEEIASVKIKFNHKIHLGFEDPRKMTYPNDDLTDYYREIRDEIKNEMDYFYHRILIHEMKKH
jgi:arsenate reductase